MAIDERHDFSIPIKTDEDLKDFIRLAFGVVLPDVQVCPIHTTPWRAFCDAYFARSPVSVWKASRGFGGKSYTLALLSLTEAATLKANVNILGGSGKQSESVLEHSTGLWAYRDAPIYLLKSDPGKQETRLTWGNAIRALMASQTSVRGPHPQRLRLDEIDEMDLTILDAAMGQPMKGKTQIETQVVMSSTHQYANGTMTEILKRAAARGWPVYEWCWKETSAPPTGWLAEDEIERKRQEVTAAMWSVEYDLQEPSPESRAIMADKVQATFKRSLGEFEGRSGEYIEIEPPVEGATYATGADWARKQDWTIIGTLRTDVRPLRLVTFERTGRLPWPQMVERLDFVNRRYGAISRNDGTGLGDVVNGYLATYSEGIIMVGRARSDMLSECISGIEHGELEAPYINYLVKELLYASVDDVYGSGHLPDCLSMLALAWMGVKGSKQANDWINATKKKEEKIESPNDPFAGLPKGNWGAPVRMG